jgi:hypothetical protein
LHHQIIKSKRRRGNNLQLQTRLIIWVDFGIRSWIPFFFCKLGAIFRENENYKDAKPFKFLMIEMFQKAITKREAEPASPMKHCRILRWDNAICKKGRELQGLV